MSEIHALYREAGKFHGHSCPGLAIGVRAAAEALRILEVEDSDRKDLSCIAESGACYLDGIQTVFGATLGTSSIEVCQRGKAAFNFYNEGKGKSVRLYLLDSPAGLSREESTERYLTAPFESVFKVTPVHFEPKPYVAASREERHCSRCGESTREAFLKVIDGEVLCQNCAEKQ